MRKILDTVRRLARDCRAAMRSVIQLAIGVIMLVITTTIGLAVKDQICSAIQLTAESQSVISAFNPALKFLPLLGIAVIGFAIIALFLHGTGGE